MGCGKGHNIGHHRWVAGIPIAFRSANWDTEMQIGLQKMQI